MGWVHRVRDLGGVLFFDLRDRYGITQVVARATAHRPTTPPPESAPSSSSPSRAASTRDRPRPSIRRSLPARSRSSATRLEILNEAKTPPFPINEETSGRRRNAVALPLSRPAPAGAAEEPGAAPSRGAGRAAVLRLAGLPRDRDADSDAIDAGGRARLPRAEPRASRRILRAAAIAADLQADPDDRRHGSLLPDRALLPRRGPARRSPARVHADRRRDVVCDRRSRLRDRRRRHQSDVLRGGPRDCDAVHTHLVRRRAVEVRVGQAGSASRNDDLRSLAGVRRRVAGVSHRSARGGTRAARLHRQGRRWIVTQTARRSRGGWRRAGGPHRVGASSARAGFRARR